jgi:hypothetical protein
LKPAKVEENIDSAPASPSHSIASLQEPDEANMSIPDEFKPKVIPLEKVAPAIIKTAPTLKSTNIQNKLSNESVAQSSSSANSLNLIDLISKMQDKFQGSVGGVNHQPTSSSAAHDSSSNSPKLHGHHLPAAENAKDFVYIDNIHGNVNYSLWTLQQNEPPGQRLRNQNTEWSQAIRLLVRSSIDGYINTETSSFNVSLNRTPLKNKSRSTSLFCFQKERGIVPEIGVSAAVWLRETPRQGPRLHVVQIAAPKSV